MKTVLQLCLALFFSTQLYAQQRLISGKVTDSSGTPLVAVNVIVKGTTNGVMTDFDGLYQIQAADTDILVFSYVGFQNKEETVGKRSTISVVLTENSTELSEVVIVGYSAMQKRSYAASASQIKREKQKAYHDQLASQIQSGSAVQALQGRVAGVVVENAQDQQATSSQIRIRGMAAVSAQNKPLVVIDGVVASHDNLEQLNPDSISSIDVLKHASATSVYGSRGQHGVILISTKLKAEKQTGKLPLYIVDGVPIKKENNHIVENLDAAEIASKNQYNSADAKEKFGKIAKHGCIVMTTYQGNFRIQNNESYAVIDENNFERTTLSPLSTFSIDVDKAAYSNIRRMINNGMPVAPDAVKIEEMVNYFNYNYPQPTDGHPFSINTEVAKTSWNPNTKIVKIGLQGKTLTPDELPASNLTFLIDVSGSMGQPNKLPLLKSAFKLLVNQLREQDKVAIVVYAGAAGVVLEPTSGKNKAKILEALDNLQAGGSTAGGQGIMLAYKLAGENFKKNGNNRVILATDGDFNVGASSDKDMQTLIEEKRKSGVFLSVLGFGYGNYKDSKLETLADKGNGNHAYIDTMQEAQKVFGKEFGGTLFTIAKDVKIQIEFNPNKVQAYRLIGYENRMLNDEDFVDDTKDAGELGSGHTVTALYEIIPTGFESPYLKTVPELKYTKTEGLQNYNNELFTVKFRYKKPEGNTSIEMVHTQNDEVNEASDDLKFASAVALFGMQLRQSKYCNQTTPKHVKELAQSGKGNDDEGYRSEFIRLVSSYENVYFE
ncbi:MAG: von Willebrand factor type A domain-containing protein [Flavobacteriaceae bacterium]